MGRFSARVAGVTRDPDIKALLGLAHDHKPTPPLLSRSLVYWDLLLLAIVVRLSHRCRGPQYDTEEKCNDAICACWSDQASSLPACKRIRAYRRYEADASCATKVSTPCAAPLCLFVVPRQGCAADRHDVACGAPCRRCFSHARCAVCAMPIGVPVHSPTPCLRLPHGTARAQTGNAYDYGRACRVCSSSQYSEFDAKSEATCTEQPACTPSQYLQGATPTARGTCTEQPTCPPSQYLRGATPTTRGACTACLNAGCINSAACGGVGTVSALGECTCNGPESGLGPTCTEYSNAKNCNGAGVVDNGGGCTCKDPTIGWGPTCSEISNAKTCNGAGVVDKDGTCTCNGPKSGLGPTCSEYSNSKTCNGAGVVDKDGTCTCTDPEVGNGPTCAEYSNSKTCNGNGVVDNEGKCTCTDPEVGNGPTCSEYSNSKTCNGAGVVDNEGKCTCDGPETGLGPTCSEFSNAKNCGGVGVVNVTNIVCPYPGRRFTTGDKVMLKPGVADSNGAIRQGQVGTIVQDDRDSRPYKVRAPGGSASEYLRESEVQCPTTTSGNSAGTRTQPSSSSPSDSALLETARQPD